MLTRYDLRSVFLLGPLLLGLPACGGDAVAEAKAEPVAQDAALATPDDLERVLRLGGHRSVADEAAKLLAAQDVIASDPADRWRIRRAQLVALASLGQREALDEAWAAAEAEHEADRLAALAGQIYVSLLEGASADEALLADLQQSGALDRGSFLAGAMQPQENLTVPDVWRNSRGEAVRRLGLPTDHPEGFPRAWLAPDERPEEP